MADFTSVLNWDFGGRIVKNVLVWDNGEESENFAIRFVESLEESANINAIAGALSNSVSLSSVTVVFNNSFPSWSVELPVTGVDGGQTGEVLPRANAILVSTQYGGVRPNRGRIYLPGVTETMSESYGQLVSTVVTSLQGYFDALVTDGISVESYGNSYLRIGRRNAAGTITASNPVTAAIVRPRTRLQRRRNYG